MPIPEYLRKHREQSEMTVEQVADRLGVPEYMVRFMEEPMAPNAELEKLLAEALDISEKEFRGEVKRPTREERQDARATYPHIRAFMLDPSRCETPAEARSLFGDQPLSLSEHNLILYLSTNALYNFCNTNYSVFEFDEYLFKIHTPLLARLEKTLEAGGGSAEEREERLNAARSNVFACDTIENIAVHIFDSFAAEFEKKLTQGESGFEEETGLPFMWRVDRELMRMEIKAPDGTVRDTIRLLDVKSRKQG